MTMLLAALFILALFAFVGECETRVAEWKRHDRRAEAEWLHWEKQRQIMEMLKKLAKMEMNS